MRKRTKAKVGDVFQIDLRDGRFAYGRVYKDATVGIYRTLTTEPANPPIGSRDFMFFVGMYEDILAERLWPIIARDPFQGNESEWPPPSCIKDPQSGAYSLYHQGEIRKSSKAECKELEEAAVWDSHHIVDRIKTTAAE